jgi:Uma2 family endonuclease
MQICNKEFSMQTSPETMQPTPASAPPAGATQCVILDSISWETYERLLAEHKESSGVHFTYDRGRLEIMVLSVQHEKPNRMLSLLVEVFAEELGIDIEGLGSTTFKRKDLDRGFEPDSCFYIQHAERIRGKEEIDLLVDPPPDLVIEVDITSPSLNKFPLFAALGIPEVWRYDGARVSILNLTGATYIERTNSLALPKVTSEALTRFIHEGAQLKRPVWLRRVREWIRQQQ